VASGIKYVASGIKYVASGIKYVASGIKYVASGIKHVSELLDSILLSQVQADGDGAGGGTRDAVVQALAVECVAKVPTVLFDVELVERYAPPTIITRRIRQ